MGKDCIKLERGVSLTLPRGRGWLHLWKAILQPQPGGKVGEERSWKEGPQEKKGMRRFCEDKSGHLLQGRGWERKGKVRYLKKKREGILKKGDTRKNINDFRKEGKKKFRHF